MTNFTGDPRAFAADLHAMDWDQYIRLAEEQRGGARRRQLRLLHLASAACSLAILIVTGLVLWG